MTTLQELTALSRKSRTGPIEWGLAENLAYTSGRSFEAVAHSLFGQNNTSAVAQSLGVLPGDADPEPLICQALVRVLAHAQLRGLPAYGLDLGCGAGIFAAQAEAKTGFPWFGADTVHYATWYADSRKPLTYDNKVVLDEAKFQLNGAPINPDRYLVADACSLGDVPDNSFAVVTSTNLLGWVPEAPVFETVHRVLQPGGVAYLSTIRKESAEGVAARKRIFDELRSLQSQKYAIFGSENNYAARFVLQKQPDEAPLKFAPESGLFSPAGYGTYSPFFPLEQLVALKQRYPNFSHPLFDDSDVIYVLVEEE